MPTDYMRSFVADVLDAFHGGAGSNQFSDVPMSPTMAVNIIGNELERHLSGTPRGLLDNLKALYRRRKYGRLARLRIFAETDEKLLQAISALNIKGAYHVVSCHWIKPSREEHKPVAYVALYTKNFNAVRGLAVILKAHNAEAVSGWWGIEEV